MKKPRRLTRIIKRLWQQDERFLQITEAVEVIVAKVLTIALLIVIIIALIDLIFVLSKLLIKSPPSGFFNETLMEIFGLFLNVLIALELLDNITAYLRKHIFQVELVIATSLIAVARKIIIFDLDKFSNIDLISLAIAIFALSISYWLVHRMNRQ
ncbi:MAG: phosphate-starvation-inducible PsiE family protein [Halothece sp.]